MDRRHFLSTGVLAVAAWCLRPKPEPEPKVIEIRLNDQIWDGIYFDGVLRPEFQSISMDPGYVDGSPGRPFIQLYRESRDYRDNSPDRRKFEQYYHSSGCVGELVTDGSLFIQRFVVIA